MTVRLRRSTDPRTELVAIHERQFHRGRTPLEAIEMLFEGERSTGGRAQRLEDSVTSLNDRVRDGDVVRRLSVDEDHGR